MGDHYLRLLALEQLAETVCHPVETALRPVLFDDGISRTNIIECYYALS